MPTTAELITACERAHKVEDQAAYSAACALRGLLELQEHNCADGSYLDYCKRKVAAFNAATEERKAATAALCDPKVAA